MTQRRAIYYALSRVIEEDSNVYLLGEDIGDYGGAFQVTYGLKKKFPNRIIETPISEGGFTGVSVGMAITGLKPITEIMFMDFSSQIVDQILNQAVKYNGMYDGKLNVPMLIRTPAGGYRGYGATHSQSLENLFASVHDLKIVYPYSIQDYYSNLVYLIRNLSSPVLFIENKSLYLKRGEVNLELFYSPAPKFFRKGGKEVLVISYGHTVDLVEEARKKVGEDWTVVDLNTLKPADLGFINKVVSEGYDRIYIATESPNYASVAEHVSCEITKHNFDLLKNPIKIIASKDQFIPSRVDLESEVLISVDKIVKEIVS